MCTLVEKEVLLDTISGTTAFIAYRTPPQADSDDLEECYLLREKLLRSDPEQIDKQEVYEKLDALKAKYEGLPVFSCYLGDYAEEYKKITGNEVI